MDFKLLKQDLDDKLFTDLSLILSDDNNTITIDVHKIVLYSSCIYFRKLLTFGKTKEKIIKINVPDVFVSKNIIESFYDRVWNNESKSYIQVGKNPDSNCNDYPEWKYTILLYKCNDFFGLDTDLNKIFYLQVPSEKFNKLLNFVDLLNYDDKLTQLLINNFPLNYDLTNLSTELLIVILEKLKLYCFITLSDNKEIKTWNNGSDNIIMNDTNYIEGKNKIYCTRDESKIICVGYNSIQYINIHENKPVIFPNKYEIEYITGAKDINFVCISSDRTILVTVHQDFTKIWDIETGTLINTLPLDWNIFSMSVSSDGNFIVVHKYNNVREIWDCENGKILLCFDDWNNIWQNTSIVSLITLYDIYLHASRDERCHYDNNMCFSPDNSEIAMAHNKTINIFNLKSGEFIKSHKIHANDEINKLVYSPKGDKIMYFIIGRKITIWSPSTDDLIMSKHNVSVACFTSDGKFVIYAYKNNIYVWDINTNEIITDFKSDHCINDICLTLSLNKVLINKIEKFLCIE
ncbi:hypothetical protein QJ854_gp927 [Moumouvirus goulette]|uniref:Serine-threonine kinase receptor-associated protein n=1 Tax=Moumouvirus goulette TaxID=1247379 RepID=M1NLH1_9VIRU|nr:hypothetical protein QJ854_gp927 [Moumouvirus goulette]AGF84855.1 hypothetical protein glt_00046 [Moumouvirus goulette]